MLALKASKHSHDFTPECSHVAAPYSTRKTGGGEQQPAQAGGAPAGLRVCPHASSSACLMLLCQKVCMPGDRRQVMSPNLQSSAALRLGLEISALGRPEAGHLGGVEKRHPTGGRRAVAFKGLRRQFRCG